MRTLTDLAKNLGLATFMVSTLWLAYGEPRVKDLIIEEGKSKKGGLGSELSEKFEIKRVNLAGRIYGGITAADSLAKFKRTLLPMLLNEVKTYDVGLKVGKLTGKLQYLHIDGHIYIPALDSFGRPYIMLPTGKTYYCL